MVCAAQSSGGHWGGGWNDRQRHERWQVNVMSDGRLLSLQATEWLILIVGGLAGSLILMF
jgi:hypothetical protein